MMTKCPVCDSSEIVPNLLIFTDETVRGGRLAYVKLVEPKTKQACLGMPVKWLAIYRLSH